MNKVSFLGRAVKDAELKQTSANIQVCKFTLAVNRKYTKGDGDEKTDFIPVTSFGKLAEICEKYIGKGKQIVVNGRLQTNKWDDKDGNRHYSTEVIAEEIYFTGNKKKENDKNEENIA